MPSPDQRRYDIIIPVFNGLGFFTPCYQTVKAYTAVGHTVVVVDDGSSEPEMKAFLSVIAQDSDTIVIHLPDNRGFVHAVNQGISFSDNHVVLLNSDTEVTPRWLEKMDAALFSSPYVGTVTPWTNNGTICSLPRFCEDNDLPSGVSANDLAEIAETVCWGEYPVLPTAVGFCMAIRREVITIIGGFDEETFGRGYGEEGDFCMRARLAGYVNILDDRTFIFHKGQMTFGSGRDAVIEAHTKILTERFPQYSVDVNAFCAQDPLCSLRSQINRRLEHRLGKRHVLHLLHRDPLEGWYGVRSGVEYHVLTLAESLQEEEGIISFIMASDGRELFFLEKNQHGTWQRKRLALPQPIAHETRYDRFFRQRLHEVLNSYHIDLLHIHHLLNFPKDLAALIDPWPGPVCLTLHDFYLSCPTINLINQAGHYCHGGSATACPTCVKGQLGSPIDIPSWRQMQRANLAYVQKTYAPSASAAQISHDLLCVGAPLPITIREHAAVKVKSVPRVPLAPGARLKVGFLGQVFRNKGSHLALLLAQTAPLDNFEWFFIGKVIDPRCAEMSQVNVHFLGEYAHEDLPGILAASGIQLMLFCSIWPETFSYTLSEAWANGIPALVGPLGAPADRIKHDGGGWVVESLTAEDFLVQLEKIRSQPDEYQRVCAQVEAMEFAPPEDVAREYLADYQQLMETHPLPDNRFVRPQPCWPGAIYDRGERITAMTEESKRLEGERQRLEGEVVTLRDHIAKLSEVVAGKEHIIAEALAQIQAFSAANQEAHANIQALQQTVQWLHQERDRLLNTLSWRLTAPLRKAATLLSGANKGA